MSRGSVGPAAGVSVGIIGAGAMGGAIARGLVASGAVEARRVWACDSDEGRLGPLRDLGIATAGSADELVAAGTDVVILAVKPQVLGALMAEVASGLEGRLVVSIAAGVPLATLEASLPGARVVRVMPNLPLQVLSGATAVTPGESAGAGDAELVRSLFSALGSAEVMREDQLDAEGAVVGCGPAFFALFVDTLTRAGVRAGLPATACREMVESTMLGVARSLLESGEHPRAYVERVTSPGGTTAEALLALEPLLERGSYEAVDAALARTRELAGD